MQHLIITPQPALTILHKPQPIEPQRENIYPVSVLAWSPSLNVDAIAPSRQREFEAVLLLLVRMGVVG